MARFRVWNEISKIELGTYEGKTTEEALDNFESLLCCERAFVLQAIRQIDLSERGDAGLRIEEIKE